MVQNGIESRVKIQQIIDSQLPEFVLEESPKAAEFLKQYYISQEYQGSSVDLAENLDQYLKLDNLIPEVVVGTTILSSDITLSDTVITVSLTKGFPQSYGLLKIDDEIITYTGITTNTFTGCIRGFSGITDYHKTLNSEELVFSESESASHIANSTVHNLSVLFLQEFYNKVKYNLTPGLENRPFVDGINVGNFIKEARTLYQSKGTEESFRILFNVLYGETPKIIDLEKFLLKPSSATYSRRQIVVADVISGDPLKLVGQTLYKNNDPTTTASISEVEVIRRKNKTYYKLLLFIGYDDSFPTITGTFNITGSSKIINSVSIGSSIITVDSTIGFPESGTLYYEENVITYTSKSINQFFGCSGVETVIPTASTIYSNETYYGYEDGDSSQRVNLRITGVLSNYKSISNDSSVSVGENITVKNLGESIQNPPINPSYKQIIANSWIYNTSSRYQIVDDFTSGSTSEFILKDDIDKSSLKIGDYVNVLNRNSETIALENARVDNITDRQISLDKSVNLISGLKYDIRRNLNTASSSSVSLEYDSLISDIQNVYNEKDEYLYVASNSLPSYTITQKIFAYDAIAVDGLNTNTGLYSKITFTQPVSFINGSEIYYKPSGSPISGLSEGVYYVEVLSGNYQIRLYASRSVIGSSNYLSFGNLTSGTHNFILNSQKDKILSPQKILRKYPLSVNIGDGKSESTLPGPVGQLINGVEILNYKSNDKIYYGPLESVNVLNGGSDYDVINPPYLEVSSGNAKIQPIVQGSVEKVLVAPQDFDIDVIVSIALTGGNGTCASFEPVIERRRREIEFDARQLSDGGGVDTTNETITFLTNHNLINGQPIIYRPGSNTSLGIGTFLGSNISTGNSLKSECTYYAKYISDKTIQLYQSLSDFRSGINTVGFTTIGTSGIHKFATEPKNTLTQIKVLNGGQNYTNKKLRVQSSGISTSSNTITFNNHQFNNGDLVTYSSTGSTISGLSTSNQYYILKVDDNKFRLSNAGVGGTIRSNYERKQYVSLGSTGSGYHIFNYPEIALTVNYSAVGLGSTQYRGTIEATPIVRGSIVGTYVYESGSDYGSTILNYHNKPSIVVKTGNYAQFSPVINNGKIEKVSVLYGGQDYYSVPDIVATGTGSGASFKPVIVNNKISEIIVINPGSGYSSNTTITAVSVGKKVIFDTQVRSLTVNNNVLFGNTNEIIRSSSNKLQYYVCGYSQFIQNQFKDNTSDHSPIIGWAYDGNPIYGYRGYSTPNNNSSIKRLVSGYTLSTSNITNRPSGFDAGFFIEDYKFTNSGDLDEYNGRFCITPEFPNGVYAYFATSVTDLDGNNTGSFPYFIGDRYRSKYVSENKFLNQSFDFNNSDLVRNTFPYKVSRKYADNDFIIESNEVINQVAKVESVFSGNIDGFEIINAGDNYKIGDTLKFSDSNGLTAQVSEIKGKDIVDLQTTVLNYNNVNFTYLNGKQIQVKIPPYHNLQNLDYVNVSGFSTSLSLLNGFQKIGVTSYSSTLIKDIPSSGIVTDIYISNIPENVSIGSSILIDSESFSVLNIFAEQNVLRVSRGSVGSSHTATSSVNFIPDTFTIDKKVDYFESKDNDLVYFNPKYSVGVGTTSGICVAVTFNIGIQTNNIISIPTQSIYLPNHPFKTNQAVILTKQPSASAISVANTSGSSAFNLPISGDSQTVYIIKQSNDYVGIVTQIGLTTSTNGVYFLNNGSDDYKYSLQSQYTQVLGNVERVSTQVSVSTSHNLISGDLVNLVVKPNLSVGIGTSTSVKVQRDINTDYILINSVGINSTGIDTSRSQISIASHGLKTGDRVKYSANVVASGLSTGFYYVYKVDNNTIKLAQTYFDCVDSYPPNTVSIASTGGSTQSIALVNPSITSIKNNNLVFDLTDSSLNGYKFKIYYDSDFKDEFVSTGDNTTFTVEQTGTVGSTAILTINSNETLPTQLYYALEKNGNVLDPDKDTQNYSQINFVDSYYNNSYNVFGVGSTTFNITLKNPPERNNYNQSQCDVLEYITKSTSAYGGISKIRTISSGFDYKKLPTFEGVDSEIGSGAYVIAKSSDIGNINEIRIINEGFEYSSDKTLRPEASISKLLTLKNYSTVGFVSITDGGRNYTSTPDLVLVNSTTGEKIDSGLLRTEILGSSIKSVNVEIPPVGLPETIVTLRAINNTNGVAIQSVQSSTSGVVTCILTTPSTGFGGNEPFAIGDKIFVEGIQKYSQDGDGFNSEDYGYVFFEVSNYLLTNPRKLEYNLSGITTNAGIAKTSENVYGNIVNYSNYPKFEVVQKFSEFILGETLQVKTELGYADTDLKISEFNVNYIKVSGSYELETNSIIKGSQSGSIATINSIKQSSGYFKVDYASVQRIGWLDDTGKLDEDFQVIPDNDYYQNLSYSIKSNQEWSTIVSPVNDILHPAGLKNFSDTQILQSANVGINSAEYTTSIYDIIEENRVDTINNFDLVLDVNTFDNSSKFLRFQTKKLADYFKCKTNRVLEIDDISSQFSSLDQSIDPTTKITNIIPTRNYNRYLIQISDKDYTKTQITELIILNNNSDVYTLEKGTLNTGISADIGYNANALGSVYGYVNELNELYLRFDPADSYNTTYNIKYLNSTFTDYVSGIGTTSIGFVNLIGVTTSVSSGFTTSLLNVQTSKVKAIHSGIHLIDNVTNEMNYVELFVDHNGTDTTIAEFYFDTDEGFSSNFIGSFGASINGGILSLNYYNTSNNNVTLRSKNIGFGTTAVGVGTYRFKQQGQLDDYENTIRYDALYSNVSSASTVISLNKNLFTSIKSTIRVSVGQTSALHQVMLVSDSDNVYTTQYPFLSIGSTSGIGTFGGEISGSNVILKFYPDPTITSNVEILSFNECFFKETDYVNTAPKLNYSNILEFVGVSKYYSLNDQDLNKLNFELRYQNTPIFMKTFDPSNTSVLNKATGEFKIQNHFFSTGEELIYRPNSTFVGVAASSVGIGSTLNHVGVVTNILPQTVYAIKISNDTFKISTRKDYANAGIYVTFTSSGSGNSHELEMVKKNEKSIISIDNVIQSPIAYSLINYTVNNGGQIGTASTVFGLSGISSINLGDILKIDNEYMKIVNVGLGTTYSGPISFAGTFPLVGVKRGFVGSSATTHANLSNASIYRGSYNISKNEIYFTDPPRGSLDDQLNVDFDNLPESRSEFNGRVFLRNDYTSNQVYDNISEKYTGIGQTYTLTVGGANTVGLGTSGGNGIVIINGIYQTPTTANNINNNFRIIENTISGISSVVFSGITSTNGSVIISQSDVNMNQLPRGGMIVSLGSTPGLGYAPLVGASVTAIVSGGIITSIGIGSTGNWGSGYRNPVSVAVTESGHVGSAATINAVVGAGGTLSFTIIGGGTGYVNPTINISSPSYSNLPVTGVSRLGIGATSDCGTGLLINVEVGASSTTGIGSTLFEVKNFEIARTGYGFKKGDVIRPVGLVTAKGLTQPLLNFELTVLETFSDSFAAWQFGELNNIDSIKNLQDGSRIDFPLYYNSKLITFEKDSSDPNSKLIDFNSLLVIFINGVLQKPGVAYKFDGGSVFTFTEPPKVKDEVSIYFYTGSTSDSQLVIVQETIKIGDDVKVFHSNEYSESTLDQNYRIVSNISTSDTIETDLYKLQGINDTIQRPLSWTKQKIDRVINGYNVSKARDSIEPQIYPTAKVIRNFTSTDTEIFVDNARFFNYENQSPLDIGALIVSGNVDPVSAAITAIVSAGGTIQSLSINNVGSGYTGSTLNVSISSPKSGINATASLTIVGGSVSGYTITNPGSGYTTSSPPQVLVPLPKPTYENITGITNLSGISGNVTGIGSTVGIGTNLAIKFTLSSTDGLSVGYPIYIFNTSVGNGVTSINTKNSDVIGIGTTFLNNVYYINAVSSGVVTCNVHSQTNVAGISTSGSIVGNFSWGRLSGFSRSPSPISIAVTGFTVNSGLTTFPTIQRRGYGLRDLGAITKTL